MFGYDEGLMRSFASICLALALAITFGWSMPALGHAGPSQAPSVNRCADMDMSGASMAQQKPAPVKRSSHGDCAMSCNLGCAVAAEDANPRIGEAISWGPAFGAPRQALPGVPCRGRPRTRPNRPHLSSAAGGQAG